MKLPRDLSGQQLAKALASLGYQFTRQVGSHMRYTTQRNGEHSITIPDHHELKPKTLSSILRELCNHHQTPKQELLEFLFGR
jgi:predicted RNA binding protein YcfA (HicA-like mRNA interferase family)